MLIGACQIGWIVYKADVISKVVDWLMKTRLPAREEEQKAPRPAMEADEAGGAEDQAEEELAEVVISCAGLSAFLLFYQPTDCNYTLFCRLGVASQF
jgi:hypothetical protein